MLHLRKDPGAARYRYEPLARIRLVARVTGKDAWN
jgi:hypothetical protein